MVCTARLLLAAFAASLLVSLGCGKKEMPPEVPAMESNNSSTASTPSQSKPAPAGVPQALKDRIDREWPQIEETGKQFLAKFAEVQAAQAAGDREKMQAGIHDANKLYMSAMDRWAEINNWVTDQQDGGKITDADAEACLRYLAPYEKRTKEWQSKNKPLKELSTVK
jgi:hypothetical protein